MQHKSLAVIYNNFNKETGTENVKAMFSVCQIFFFQLLSENGFELLYLPFHHLSQKSNVESYYIDRAKRQYLPLLLLPVCFHFILSVEDIST